MANIRDVFTIKLLHYDDYNKGVKKSFKKTLIPNNFGEVGALSTVSINAKWLYFKIITWTADVQNNTITKTRQSMNNAITKRERCENTVDELVENQLVTYSIKEYTPYKKRKEKKGKEPPDGDQKTPDELHHKNNTVSHQNVNKVSKFSKKTKEISKEVDVAHQPVLKNLDLKKVSKDNLLSENCRIVVAAYCASYKNRYGQNPIVTKVHAGRLKHLLASIGPQNLSKMVQVYVQMEDPWFVKKYHDLETFFQNLNKVKFALAKGQDPDAKEDPYAFMNENNKEMEIL